MGCATSILSEKKTHPDLRTGHDAPTSADWAYADIESIFLLLEPQHPGKPPPVRLLDSVWLLNRASQLESARDDAQRAALALPSRQVLEKSHPEAFLSTDQVRNLAVHSKEHGYWQPTGAIAVGSVSHAWLSPHHPDPLGQQLIKLMALVRAAQQKELPRQQLGWDANAPRRQGYNSLPERCGIFYDWCSLCQSHKAPDGSVLIERTPDEREAFKLALDSMQLWYAHQKIFAMLITELPEGCTAPPYDARGWPTVERAWTMLSKPNNTSCWPMIYEVGSPSGEPTRAPPMHPDRLNALLATKRFTSESADRPLVERLYQETTLAVLGEADKLSFGEAGWTDADFVSLAEVLLMCKRCCKLNLGRNACGDDGAAAIATVARREGVLGELRVLALNDNQIGDAGFAALARAASAGAFPSLVNLFLMNNRIGSAGCTALARSLQGGAMPSLQELRLSGNKEATGIDTPLCHFWASGKCKKGEQCAFRHESDPAKPAAWVELERVCQAREPVVALWRHREEQRSQLNGSTQAPATAPAALISAWL